MFLKAQVYFINDKSEKETVSEIATFILCTLSFLLGYPRMYLFRYWDHIQMADLLGSFFFFLMLR
jgi:hypothetical protein